MQRQALPQNYMKRNITLFDDFSTVGSWVSSDVSKATVSTDTTNVLTGTSSVKATTGSVPANTYCSIDKQTVNFNLQGKTKVFMLKVWIDDPTNIKQILFYLGSSPADWSKYWNFPFDNVRLHSGWNYLLAFPNEGSFSGGFTFDDQIVKMRITIVTQNTSPAILTFDSISFDLEGKPRIVITFDDGWKSVYDNAMNVMYQRGIKGTMYTIPWYLSDMGSPYSASGYMSRAEIAEMRTKGFTIANHTWNHEYYKTNNSTVANYVAQVEKARDWLKANGYENGALHLAYPKGEHDSALTSALKSIGMKTGRFSGGGAGALMPNFVDDYFEMPVRGLGNATALSLAKKWVDLTLESGGTSFFMFHQIPIDDTIDTTQSQPGLSWSASKFQQLMDYIAERGAAQYCVTIDEWFEGVTNPRYTSFPLNRIIV